LSVGVPSAGTIPACGARRPREKEDKAGSLKHQGPIKGIG